MCRHSFVDVGEALFEQGLELKYVLRLQRGLKFKNIAFLFYVWTSLELIKLQGDLHQKWMVLDKGAHHACSDVQMCILGTFEQVDSRVGGPPKGLQLLNFTYRETNAAS